MHTFMTVIVIGLSVGLVGTAAAQTAMPSPQEVPALEEQTLDVAPAAPAPNYRYTRDGEITMERPRATQRLKTVGKRRFQVETSFDYQAETDTAATRHQYSFPTKMRYGVANKLEVQVQGNMFTIQDTKNTNATRGFDDLFLGAKWNALEGGGLLPSVGLSAQLGLPTGSNNVSGNALQPRADVLMAWEMPWELALDGNVGFEIPSNDLVGNRRARVTYGAAVERTLPLFAERTNAFVEFAGAASTKNRSSSVHQFGTGFGFRINDNMQLATFGRVGINRAAPNFQTGLNFGWRM